MKKTGPFINQEEISHYLKDVRKIDVLTVNREKMLAKIMLNNPTPEQKEQIEKELMLGNLRFVISVRDYKPRSRLTRFNAKEITDFKKY